MSEMNTPVAPATPAPVSPETSNPAPEAVESSEESSAPQAKGSVSSSEAADLQEKKDSGEKLTKKEEKQLKEYKLKVNGKERSVKIDMSNDEEVKRHLQKALAADESFKESSEVRKAAMSFIEELKKNPKKVLSDPNIGVDLKKFAEEIMNEAIQEMEKSPEQKEREKLTKELEDLKNQREKEKKDWEEKEFARLQAQHEKQLETDISAALDIGGLPKTAHTVSRMAHYMMIAMENGIELTPQEIAPIVKNETLGGFKELINSLSDDQLEEFMGKEILGRLRKKQVAKAKAQPIETSASVKPTGSEVKKEEVAIKKQNYREFFGF